MSGKITAPAIRARKGGEKITMVTAYDTPSASIASEAGADMVLVGDSLANVVLGHETTIPVDMDVMIHHAAAVARAKPHSLVIGDMPWLSFHVSIEDTVRNAGRFVREGGVEAVKLEGGAKRVPVIAAILDCEIPVLGHIGLTPQSVHAMGGYRVQGKGAESAERLLEDAKVLDDAGVFALVLEGVPDVLAQVITKNVTCPTIGIGAGPHCDGQVLVFHDVLGLHDGHYPKFVRPYADLRSQAIEALRHFFDDVRSESFPSDDETYHMPDDAARALLAGPSHDELAG